MADAQTPPWYASIGDNLTKLGTAYLSVQQQKQLNNINLERAKQNLPPLDTSQYQTGVNVGVSRSTQNTVLIMVATVAGVWLLTSLLERR